MGIEKEKEIHDISKSIEKLEEQKEKEYQEYKQSKEYAELMKVKQQINTTQSNLQKLESSSTISRRKVYTLEKKVNKANGELEREKSKNIHEQKRMKETLLEKKHKWINEIDQKKKKKKKKIKKKARCHDAGGLG